MPRKPTPGKENWINSSPKIRIKKNKKVYRNVYTHFDASKTKDSNGDKLKFRWDFGDGHRSYREKTKHRYEKKKKYQVTLRVDDGSNYFYESFRIEVKSFPKRDVRLVKLVPNPKGRDSGRETIVIENRSNKKINLIDYKIATGKDKNSLVSHLIYDDFVLKPGERRIITNEKICKFSLMNKMAQVVFYYPDGKKADEVEYRKEKIGEDEAYELVAGEWEWVGGEIEIGELVQKDEAVGEIIKKEMDFGLVTINEKLGICECLDAMRIVNWLEKNSRWLKYT